MTREYPDGINDFSADKNKKWRTCWECGEVTHKAVVYFDSGSATGTSGETVTGATSADTGVISDIQRTGGTWAGADASGYMILTSPTGYDSEAMEVFVDNEELNGSTAGSNFATVNGVGSLITDGLLHPEDSLIFFRGKWYCRPHFEMRWKKALLDEAGAPSTDEGDRNR